MKSTTCSSARTTTLISAIVHAEAQERQQPTLTLSLCAEISAYTRSPSVSTQRQKYKNNQNMLVASGLQHGHIIHHVSTVHTINTIKKINMVDTWRALCGYFFNSIQYVVRAENVSRFRFHTVQRFHIIFLY